MSNRQNRQPLRHRHIGHGLHGGVHALDAHGPVEDGLAAWVFCREAAEQFVEKASCAGFDAGIV